MLTKGTDLRIHWRGRWSWFWDRTRVPSGWRKYRANPWNGKMPISGPFKALSTFICYYHLLLLLRQVHWLIFVSQVGSNLIRNRYHIVWFFCISLPKLISQCGTCVASSLKILVDRSGDFLLLRQYILM